MKDNGRFQHLQDFTDEETFYYKYHQAKQTPSQLKVFLSAQGASYLSINGYVVPEMKSSLDLHFPK